MQQHYALALAAPSRTVTHLTLSHKLYLDHDHDADDTRHGTSTSATTVFSPWRHR